MCWIVFKASLVYTVRLIGTDFRPRCFLAQSRTAINGSASSKKKISRCPSLFTWLPSIIVLFSYAEIPNDGALTPFCFSDSRFTYQHPFTAQSSSLSIQCLRRHPTWSRRKARSSSRSMIRTPQQSETKDTATALAGEAEVQQYR